ncbi:MAG: GNAT family N-acetyltransferase [Nonlabens sp.]|uniref:GNAT family N-acetyltransferase n=1 Tax=Nonlabens sp. TaxID=1888209 RepID=UPI003EF14FB0
MRLVRTDSHNEDFIALVKELDTYLAIADGEDHAFYDQFNKLDHIKNVVVAYKSHIPVGCGAIKKYDSRSVEIKRMYTQPAYRGNGIASLILKELEKWSAELLFERCILETGSRQEEAIALYKKSNYEIIENYGQYTGIANSYCFEKKL